MENMELISKAVAYVKSNANKSDITISDISVYAGFSTDYFNRIFLSHTGFTKAFKKYYGMPPHEYRTKRRICSSAGNFSASDMGFQVVNWRYTVLN